MLTSKNGKPSEDVETLRMGFDDFDGLAQAVRGWDIDFRQLDGGTLRAELLRVTSDHTMLQRVRLSRHSDQRGATPPGMRTFAVLEAGVSGIQWYGRSATASDLLCFSSKGDFEAVSRPGFGVRTISISEEHLDRVARAGGRPEAAALLGSAEQLLPVAPKLMRALRAALDRICDAVDAPRSNGSAQLLEALSFEVPSRIFEALAAGVRPKQPSARLRDHAYRAARDYIEARRDLPLTVREVCEAIGASERVLRYAFRDHMGVSPKAYLRALRLDGARRKLRRAGAGDRIADVANRWGFWHMGQFAADYHRHYGELPSATLSNAEHEPPGSAFAKP